MKSKLNQFQCCNFFSFSLWGSEEGSLRSLKDVGQESSNSKSWEYKLNGKKKKQIYNLEVVCKWTWAHVRLYTLRTRHLLWAIKKQLPLCGTGFCSLILSLSLSESNFLYQMLFSSLQPNGNVDIQQLWDHNFVFVSQRKLLLQCLRLCSKSCKNYELIKSKPLVTVRLKPGKMYVCLLKLHRFIHPYLSSASLHLVFTVCW